MPSPYNLTTKTFLAGNNFFFKFEIEDDTQSTAITGSKNSKSLVSTTCEIHYKKKKRS